MNQEIKIQDFGYSQPIKRTDFPADFVWGVATSAYQIEGAAEVDGKGLSIWDTFCRKPGVIADASHGEEACDHYHRFRQDLQMIAQLGVNAYRFSISWPRVQPHGSGAWNDRGFAFYDQLLDEMLSKGLDPYATLYHWDLPQTLQDQGGWGCRDTCYRFADYAHEVMRRLGDRLASVVTHNEPWVIAILGHEQGLFAPGIQHRATAMQVAHHLLVSHGLAVEAMRSCYEKIPMGMVLNQSPMHADGGQNAVQKAKLADGLIVRWYMDALLKGQYPTDVWEHLGSDVPIIVEGDMEKCSIPIDFIGINYYTRQLIQDHGVYQPDQMGLPVTDMNWEIYPQGLTELVVRLHQDYTLPPLYITENGAAFPDKHVQGQVDDQARIRYLQSHMAAVKDAMKAGVDVRGYFVWSLMDNFEWASGYAKRFGIVYVDYVTQERTLKNSAKWYQSFLNGV